jgi:hypothetical protein
MRTMQAVSLLCTSFPPDLRRIARSRAARAVVWVLALALSVTNMTMAAMPSLASAAVVSGAAASHQISHDAHCAGHAMPASSRAHCAGQMASAHANHAGHGDGCGCCIGKTCACVQVCDVPTVIALVGALAPSARQFSVLPSRPYAAIEARILRPPIA